MWQAVTILQLTLNDSIVRTVFALSLGFAENVLIFCRIFEY